MRHGSVGNGLLGGQARHDGERRETNEMNAITVLMWVLYGGFLLFISRATTGRDALLPGKVGVVVQAFAYVATYVSAVALVGFSGLGHSMGLQIEMVAMGVMWFGVWFVYRFVAWPTKIMQRRLGAKTPIEMLSKGYGSKGLGKFMAALAGVLLIIYCSAVFKGAALVLASAVPVTDNQALWLLVGLVALSVTWGGLRGVLYTEAVQGFVMTVGVLALIVGTMKYVGGPAAALDALAELPPTPQANRGFLSLSSGAAGMNIIFLSLVTSVGVWAQPQLIQRHFALKSREEGRRIIPVAMLVVGILLGGAFFVGGISRLILGPEVPSADSVIPMLVRKLLPGYGRQIFAMAIVSASLSTASALLHVSSACLGRDVLEKRLDGWNWKIAVAGSALASGLFAVKSSSIIALVCSTSWTLVAGAMWVPYIALISMGPVVERRSAWLSSLSGTIVSIAWYAFGYAPTSLKFAGISAPGLSGHLHPLIVGVLASGCGLGIGLLLQRSGIWERSAAALSE